MIHDSIKNWRRIPGFQGHPIWSEAFQWLEANAATAPEGFHQLGEEGFYARVMAYPLKDRSAARYEAHRRTIDIQYTIDGAEGIELCAEDDLVARNDYSDEKDVEFFETPPQGVATVENLVGRFTVLYPGEAHLPQLGARGHKAVRKVVVKVPAKLVE